MSISAEAITTTVLRYYPDVQAIYLFGSHASGEEWPSSDVDLALLFPFDSGISTNLLMMSECRATLELSLGKPVDLVSARDGSTVFQKEIIAAERLLFSQDENARIEFEMYTLSFYQKLNEERAEILADFNKTGKAYKV